MVSEDCEIFQFGRYKFILDLSGWKSQFVKAKPLVYINYGTKYDYGSIMHYPAYLGPYYAMTAKEPGGESQMGQRVQLAQTDINLINAMYCLTP